MGGSKGNATGVVLRDTVAEKIGKEMDVMGQLVVIINMFVFLNGVNWVVEIIKHSHVLSVHKEMVLVGAMVYVNGIMDSVFPKVSLQQVGLLF